jgi:predicted MFS family arabinose efflux permease
MQAGRNTIAVAAALALGAAVSLGLARFSYALLLPPMRADLGWTYLVAGAMNTANAAGYLAGALASPCWLTRHDARRAVLAGGAGTVVVLAAHGLAPDDAWLYVLRFAAGVASAAMFIGGGLLAARLAQDAGRPGVVLGLYYGGTGLGIIVSALAVPPLPWRTAWLVLAAVALAATVVLARATRDLHATRPADAGHPPVRWPAMGFALGGYLMFGLGYIGYMTFIVTLLREQGTPPAMIVGFYVLLGAGVIASSWLWARLLERARDGQALALLNGLLALATVAPVLSSHPATVTASGVLFGCVFLSVVTSTTAFVRHNLPPAAWAAGISAFTIVFAAGQILGPSFTGWLADGPGGLPRGLLWSAAFLAAGAALALLQKPLAAARRLG